uniref:Uncharacterized protein n=1 Tax=Arundo donax TaxID=35708 RepID=A0A0A9HFG0_ARUDO
MASPTTAGSESKVPSPTEGILAPVLSTKCFTIFSPLAAP